MMNNVRKSTVRACPVHTALKDKAENELIKNGAYSHEKLLDDLSFALPVGYIRWDYIREFIEEDNSIRLIPVVAPFFKKHSTKDERVNPEKYLPTGRGKKTAGYVSVTAQNGHLVVFQLNRQVKLSHGVMQATEQLASAVERAGIAVPPTPLALVSGSTAA